MKIESLVKSNSLPLNRKTIINILFTANIVQENISKTLKNYDLTAQQFNVLRILRGQNQKPANLSTIQERMINKKSNTTRIIDRLINKDLVTRITCKENRRKIELTITKKGTKLLHEIDPIFDKTEDNIVNKLSENELNTLNNILDKLK